VLEVRADFHDVPGANGGAERESRVSKLRCGSGLSGIGWDGKRIETLNVDKNLRPQSALRSRRKAFNREGREDRKVFIEVA
jgi:hypothetical protein